MEKGSVSKEKIVAGRATFPLGKAGVSVAYDLAYSNQEIQTD